jgi:hypothetical protein
MSKKLGFNISDLLAQPVTVSPTTSSSLSLISDLATSSNEYHHDRQIESTSTISSTLPLNESNNHLSNYEQLMRASSIYRNQDYSLLPIVNGTYPWIQTDSILKDRFSCKFISLLTFYDYSHAKLNFLSKVFNNQRRLGHPYQNRTPPKRKKPRTSFTRLQILVNKNCFFFI